MSERSESNIVLPRDASRCVGAAIVEKPGFIAIPFTGTLVAYWASCVVALPDMRNLGSLIVVAIPAALVALDVALAGRRRSMRAVRKARVEIVDRGRPRLVKRRDIRVVTPSREVTLALIAALVLVATGIGRGIGPGTLALPTDSYSAGELYGRSLLGLSLIGTLAVAMHHRSAYRRIVLKGERWGAWFAREDADRLFAAPPDSRRVAFVPLEVDASALAREARAPREIAP